MRARRRVAVAYATQIEWSSLVGLTDIGDIAAAAESLLETEVFSTQTAYDALNRPVSLTTPDSSEVRPTYNEASLLEKVDVRIRGAAEWTSVVDDIDYDAKGQRERIEYGNGTATTYSYDPLTFRLTRLRTVRASDGAVLQNLSYTHDPVGNITAIADSAQQTVFFNNDVVSPSTEYVYDAIYRLIRADGREHAGGIGNDQRDQNDVPLMNLPHANDSAALRNYTELYGYDAVGNILSMIHQAGMAGSWTRRYEVAAASNRLLSTSLPGDGEVGPYSAEYEYDAHGNMTSMPHLSSVGWDHKDQMQSSDLGGGGVVYYTYDAAGQRVRKVWEHSGLVEERIYLGEYEVYRKWSSVGLLLERQTLHVMDGVKRVALVETKTVDTAAGGGFVASTVVRFQMGNHLGSAVLEVDGAGAVISYEEYHPYGTTAYSAGASEAEVSRKRYRYTGKEKDEGTGLYYHGARYYAPWLGRWSAADPAGMLDGPNLYRYTRNNPIMGRDPNGTDTEPSPEDGLAPVAAPLTKSDLQSVRTYVARGYAGANPLTDNADANAVLIAAQIAGSRGGMENPVWEFIPPSESHMAALIAAVKVAGPLTLEALAADWGNVSPDDRRFYIMNRLHEEYKYSPEAAAGIVGNLQTESGFLPTRIQSGLDDAHPLRAPNDGGKKTDFTPYDLMSNVTPGFRPQNDKKLPPNTGLGLAQWTEPKRRAGLFEHNYKGRQGLTVLFDMDAQIDYLVQELETLKGFKGLKDLLRKPGVSTAEASEQFLRDFENPTDVAGQVRARVQQAEAARRAYLSWVKNLPHSP